LAVEKARAVFLDRDGTLLRERGYLGDPRRLRFYERSFDGLRLLRRTGFKLFIITNQSGVGRGYFTLSQLSQVNAAFQRALLKKGVRIDGIYFCPHLPEAGCSCRKPRPGLVRRAQKQFRLDLKRSYVIGDQVRDIELARKVGAKGILVLTGAGRTSRASARKWSTKITSDVASASRWILKDYEQSSSRRKPGSR